MVIAVWAASRPGLSTPSPKRLKFWFSAGLLVAFRWRRVPLSAQPATPGPFSSAAKVTLPKPFLCKTGILRMAGRRLSWPRHADRSNESPLFWTRSIFTKSSFDRTYALLANDYSKPPPDSSTLSLRVELLAWFWPKRYVKPRNAMRDSRLKRISVAKPGPKAVELNCRVLNTSATRSVKVPLSPSTLYLAAASTLKLAPRVPCDVLMGER